MASSDSFVKPLIGGIKVKSRDRSLFWLLAAVTILALMIGSGLMTSAAGQVVDRALIRGYSSYENGSWSAESFGWFYYDLDHGTGGEELNIEVNGREIEEGHIIYSTDAWPEDFEFDPWGEYRAISFLGKKYFAGYPKMPFTEAVSSLEEGELREIQRNDDLLHVVTPDRPLSLEEGYELSVGDVSMEGDEVKLILLKNGEPVDVAVVAVGDTYVYEVGDFDLPIIMVHLSNAMRGRDESRIEVDGTFQLSDLPLIELFIDGRIGKLEVKDLSEDAIVLASYDDITLNKDSFIPLIGGLMLRVTDDPSLNYYPLGEISEYGYQIIRSPVFSEYYILPYFTQSGFLVYSQAIWDWNGFTGFYFDDEKEIGGERLFLYGTEDRSVLPRHFTLLNDTLVGQGFEYNTFVQPVEFEFEPWGYYNVVTLLGELWFAGFGLNTSFEIGNASMIESYQLGKVLLDLGDEYTAVGGKAFFLQDGYELHILDVGEDKLFAQLIKNDEVLDAPVIRSNSTYIYRTDLGDVKDMPLIAIHLGSVFSNETMHFATIDGIFQIGDSYLLPVESGIDFGELEIQYTAPDYIILGNSEGIDLKRDSIISLWPGVNMAVADNDTLRYYIYTTEYVVPPPKIISLYWPREIAPGLGPVDFTISILAGEIVSFTAEIIDSEGRTVFMTYPSGSGSGDRWDFSWQWNGTVTVVSDDRSILTDAQLDLMAAALYLNDTSEPVYVAVRFDENERLAKIEDVSGNLYYVSKSEYNLSDQEISYEDMLNDSRRTDYIKVEPEVSKIRFYTLTNGSSTLEESNHTLSGPIGSLEPHLMQAHAPPGRYELKVRVENIMDALSASGLFFNVTEHEQLSLSLGNSTADFGENVTLPLELPQTYGEKYIEITYNPEVVNATEISGTEISGNVSYRIDNDFGKIEISIPADVDSLDITFRAKSMAGSTDLEIVKVEGFLPDYVNNGSIAVANTSTGSDAEKKKSNASLIGIFWALLFARIARRRSCR